MLFAEFRESLWVKYHELVYFMKPSVEKTEAIKTLEEIFIKDGPAGPEAFMDRAIIHFTPKFQSKIQDHITKLESQCSKSASSYPF